VTISIYAKQQYNLHHGVNSCYLYGRNE